MKSYKSSILLLAAAAAAALHAGSDVPGQETHRLRILIDDAEARITESGGRIGRYGEILELRQQQRTAEEIEIELQTLQVDIASKRSRVSSLKSEWAAERLRHETFSAALAKDFKEYGSEFKRLQEALMDHQRRYPPHQHLVEQYNEEARRGEQRGKRLEAKHASLMRRSKEADDLQKSVFRKQDTYTNAQLKLDQLERQAAGLEKKLSELTEQGVARARSLIETTASFDANGTKSTRRNSNDAQRGFARGIVVPSPEVANERTVSVRSADWPHRLKPLVDLVVDKAEELARLFKPALEQTSQKLQLLQHELAFSNVPGYSTFVRIRDAGSLKNKLVEGVHGRIIEHNGSAMQQVLGAGVGNNAAAKDSADLERTGRRTKRYVEILSLDRVKGDLTKRSKQELPSLSTGLRTIPDFAQIERWYSHD